MDPLFCRSWSISRRRALDLNPGLMTVPDRPRLVSPVVLRSWYISRRRALDLNPGLMTVPDPVQNISRRRALDLNHGLMTVPDPHLTRALDLNPGLMTVPDPHLTQKGVRPEPRDDRPDRDGLSIKGDSIPLLGRQPVADLLKLLTGAVPIFPCYPIMLPGETSTPLPVAAEAYTPPDAPPCSCQKARRRSSRLIFKERSLSNSRAIQDGPMGFFEILPVEMIYNILYELSIVDLSILTIVSKAVRGLVECFMDSKRGEDRLLLRVSLHQPACQEHHARLMQHFRRLGVLHKRVTCLYTTRDRLRIMEQFIRKLDLLSCLSCSNQCLALTCYGRFLHTVIAGWDEMECLRVYAIINSHVQRRLTQVLQSAHDGAVWLEMGDAESNTPASTVVLAELGSAIKTLHNYCREWTEDDIIGVIEEVTALPETWTPENVARLLTLCGENICVKLLGSKAINGRLEELAEVIVHLAKVCVKEHYSTQWVIQVTRCVCRYMDIPADRRSFLMAIPQTFKEFLMDMHDDAGKGCTTGDGGVLMDMHDDAGTGCTTGDGGVVMDMHDDAGGVVMDMHDDAGKGCTTGDGGVVMDMHDDAGGFSRTCKMMQVRNVPQGTRGWGVGGLMDMHDNAGEATDPTDLYYMISSYPLSPILTIPPPPLGEDTDPTDLYYMLEAQTAFQTELMKRHLQPGQSQVVRFCPVLSFSYSSLVGHDSLPAMPPDVPLRWTARLMPFSTRLKCDSSGFVA
uniref:F-box domain-containing protein n=1 Tax=Branchiostoma floridae TaxID=7739 RepID=C3ZKF1_BRAFL|eukprot:XP_002591039.1 hypothetical protein BRAFLDRAFT_69408 [Branchiostoma floridae]